MNFAQTAKFCLKIGKLRTFKYLRNFLDNVRNFFDLKLVIEGFLYEVR